jgi:hypothetical protein
MSRKTVYKDSRLTVVTGTDHALGLFYQLFDKEMENETPEGEGLVLDWSQFFGFEANYTGIPNSEGLIGIIEKYVTENGDSETNFNLN